MKITVESTTKIVTLAAAHGGAEIEARIWEGVTDRGIPVHCYITRLAVADDQDQSQFEAELKSREHRAPSVAVLAIPLRMIL